MVTYAVIGAGAISRSACKSIQGNEDSRVLGLYDPHRARARELAAAHDIRTVFASAAELISCAQVDAVYLAVPNKFHAEYALQCLNAGKHVILDKPFAMNLAEAKEVAAAAQRSGRQFMVGMNQRFGEGPQKIRRLVERGVLGEIYHAKTFWQRRQGIPRLGTWFGNKALAGGGAMLDIGVHMLDLCLFLLGNFEPKTVSGSVYTKFGNRGLGEGGWGKSDREAIAFDVDDFASATIRLSGGVSVTLDATWACHTAEADRRDVQLFGTEAGAGVFPARLFRQDPLRTGYDVVEDVAADLRWPHQDRFTNFTNAILGREELAVTLEQSLAVQSILDAVYESSRTGHEVNLG